MEINCKTYSVGNEKRYIIDVDDYQLFLLKSALFNTLLCPSSFLFPACQDKYRLLSDIDSILNVLKQRSINL